MGQRTVSLSHYGRRRTTRLLRFSSKARMKDVKSLWLPLSVAASFLAVGIPYWWIPYGKVNLPSALLGPGLIVVVISALLLRIYDVAALWRVIWMVGGSVALAVMTRVVVDGVRDPTSHNLWPFEVIIALVVGFACSASGAIVGGLIARLLSSRIRDGES